MCTFSYSFLSGFLSFHFPCVFIYFPSSSIHPCCLLFSLFSLVFLFLLSLLVCLCCFNHVLFLPLVPSFLSLIWFLPHLSFFLTASTFPYILPLLSFFCLFPPFVFFVLYSFINVFSITFYFSLSCFSSITPSSPPRNIHCTLSVSLCTVSHVSFSLFSLLLSLFLTFSTTPSLSASVLFLSFSGVL